MEAEKYAARGLLRQDAPAEELIFDGARTGRRRHQMMVCFESAVKKAGMVGFRFHDLRCTFAIRLRATGTHETDIMALHRALDDENDIRLFARRASEAEDGD